MALSGLAATIRAMATSPSRSRSTPVRSRDLIPPPNASRALLFAGGAAGVGAVAWGLVIQFADMEIGWLAWGIGALIGAAMVKGGGHGTALAIVSGVLALLSIAAGKAWAYQSIVGEMVEQQGAFLEATHDYDTLAADAKGWAALGSNPSSDAVRTYMAEYGYEGLTPSEFREGAGVMLETFAAVNPPREAFGEPLAEAFAPTFLDVVTGQNGKDMLFDLLFVALGIGTAFGLVMKHTTELRLQARRAAREARDEDGDAHPEGA